MEFKKWLESYTNDLVYLRNYMRQKPLDLPNFGWEFLHWRKSDEILRRLKISKKQLEAARENDSDDYYYTTLEKIEQGMTEDEKTDFLGDLQRHNPAEAPTWSYLDYERMVKPDTWLIHFTNAADNITQKGFTHGMDDMTKLGLTTHYRDDSGYKKFGGYNFAFEADSKYAKYAAHDRKYGNEAILFQAAGVKAYHYGDEESQVMFWGKSVSPNRVIRLSRDGDDWCVTTSGSMYEKNRECAYRSSFPDVVNWVERNYQQYRHQIAGHWGRSEL